MANTKSVAELCVEQQTTAEQLSQKSGVELGRVNAILLGRWTPSPQDRERIASALGVPKDDITWGHKTPIQHIYGNGPG